MNPTMVVSDEISLEKKHSWEQIDCCSVFKNTVETYSSLSSGADGGCPVKDTFLSFGTTSSEEKETEDEDDELLFGQLATRNGEGGPQKNFSSPCLHRKEQSQPQASLNTNYIRSSLIRSNVSESLSLPDLQNDICGMVLSIGINEYDKDNHNHFTSGVLCHDTFLGMDQHKIPHLEEGEVANAAHPMQEMKEDNRECPYHYDGAPQPPQRRQTLEHSRRSSVASTSECTLSTVASASVYLKIPGRFSPEAQHPLKKLPHEEQDAAPSPPRRRSTIEHSRRSSMSSSACCSNSNSFDITAVYPVVLHPLQKLCYEIEQDATPIIPCRRATLEHSRRSSISSSAFPGMNHNCDHDLPFNCATHVHPLQKLQPKEQDAAPCMPLRRSTLDHSRRPSTSTSAACTTSTGSSNLKVPTYCQVIHSVRRLDEEELDASQQRPSRRSTLVNAGGSRRSSVAGSSRRSSMASISENYCSKGGGGWAIQSIDKIGDHS